MHFIPWCFYKWRLNKIKWHFTKKIFRSGRFLHKCFKYFVFINVVANSLNDVDYLLEINIKCLRLNREERRVLWGFCMDLFDLVSKKDCKLHMRALTCVSPIWFAVFTFVFLIQSLYWSSQYFHYFAFKCHFYQNPKDASITVGDWTFTNM